MKRRTHQIWGALAAAGIMSGMLANPVEAQHRPDRNVQKQLGPGLVIATFEGDHDAGLGIARALRNKVPDRVNDKDINVIEGTKIDQALSSSGFSASEPLRPADLGALAKMLSADFAMDGTISKTATGYHVEAYVRPAQEPEVKQLLGTVDADKVEDAAGKVAELFDHSVDQLKTYHRCWSAYYDHKYHDAMDAALEGIKLNPNGVLIRWCAGKIVIDLVREKAVTVDSLLATAKSLLAADPKNLQGLKWALDVYKSKNDTANRLATLQTLATVDPDNQALQLELIGALAQSGQFDKAGKFVDDALKQNPGDPELLNLAAMVYIAAKDWQKLLSTEDQIAKADTAGKDSVYFERSIAAYAALKQPDKVVEMLKGEIDKYPKKGDLADLYLRLGGALKEAKQDAPALAAFKKSAEIDFKYKDTAAVQIVVATYLQAKNDDSVIAAARWAGKVTGDPAKFSVYPLAIGGKLTNELKNASDTSDFSKAARYIALADSMKPAADNKGYLGLIYFQLAGFDLTLAGTTKSCDFAKAGKAALETSSPLLKTGGFGADIKAAVDQALGVYDQMEKAAEQNIKALCSSKGAGTGKH